MAWCLQFKSAAIIQVMLLFAVFLQEAFPTAASCGSGVQATANDEGLSGDGDCAEQADPQTAQTPTTGLQNSSATIEFIWLKGTWTLCNATCDGGEMFRPVICYGRRSHVRDRYCQAPKPRVKDQCAMQPCPGKWKISVWSQCTASCGVGIQWRHIGCHLRHPHSDSHEDAQDGDRNVRDTRSTTSLALCNPSVRPQKVRFCEGTANNCPLPERMHTNNRDRLQRERNPDITPTRSTRSEDENRPNHQALIAKRSVQQDANHEQSLIEVEHEEFFHIGDEIVGSWRVVTGPCSVSCGGGVRKHSAVCQASDHGRHQIYNDVVCSRSPKPRTRYTQCHNRACPILLHQWLEADWLFCSARCGNGTRHRRQICVKMTINVTDNGYQNPTVEREASRDLCGPRPPARKEPCQAAPCGIWITGKWSECSAQCGATVGRQWRTVECRAPDSGRPSANCAVRHRPMQSRTCSSARNCSFGWQFDLSNCSKECGGGTLVLTAVCRASLERGGTILPEFVCGRDKKPRSRREICNPEPCPLKEVIEDWEPCQRSCGSGIRVKRRCIRYVDPESRELIGEPRCTVLEEQICNAIDCPYTIQWSQWSNCSSDCGEGQQSRSPTCQRMIANGTVLTYADGEEELNPECEAALQEDELAIRTCVGENCVYKWRTGDWGECSTTCDTGYLNRNITCCREETPGGTGRTREQLVDDGFCLSQAQPSSSKPCNANNPCPRWVESSRWGECNASCNGRGWSYRLWDCVVGDRLATASACRHAVQHEMRARRCRGVPCPVSPKFVVNDVEVSIFPPVIAERGTMVTLNCPVSGYPPPQVSWSWLDADKHQYYERERGRSLKLLQRGQVLQIPARAVEHLLGRFTCTAQNSLLQKTKAAGEMLMESPPTFNNAGGQLGQVMEKATGDYLQFPCQVNGYPRPTVSFEKDGVAIAEAERGLVHGGSVCNCIVNDTALLIPNMTFEDAGTYRCIAENRFRRVVSSPLILRVTARRYWKAIQGSCSKSCGTGTRTFHQQCFEEGAGVVDDDHCAGINQTRPQPVSCYEADCPPKLKVRWGPWSSCNVTCGPGTQTRRKICRSKRDQNNRTVEYPMERCFSGMTPDAVREILSNQGQTQTCHVPCPGVWRYMNRGPCSVTCGPGVQHLRAQCMRYTRNHVWRETKSEGRCRDQPKLASRRCFGLPSNSTECLPRLWLAMQWESCDNFYRTRQVICYRGGKKVRDSVCGQPKPVTRQACVQWNISRWSQCVDCVKRRNVSCIYILTRVSVPHSYCREVAEEPVRFQSCGTCPQHHLLSQSRPPNTRPNSNLLSGDPSQCTKQGLHYCSRVMSLRLCSKPYYQENCFCACKRIIHAAREAV
eukprot:scpid2698/ scgid0759/ A disintegrin and metalloproteinase with thrombospondin motifs 20